MCFDSFSKSLCYTAVAPIKEAFLHYKKKIVDQIPNNL